MAGITQTDFSVSFIDLAGKKRVSTHAKSKTSEAFLLERLREADPESAGALEKQLDDIKKVTAQLKDGKSSVAQSKKAAAAEKIKRIKAEIQMLKTMGGDPKLIARQIARLARELASAVREYASAGTTPLQSAEAGSPVDVSSGGSGSATEAAGGEAANPAATTPASNVSAVSAVSASADSSAPGTKDQATGNSQPEKSQSASPAPFGVTPAEAARQYAETQQQKYKSDLQQEVDKIKDQAARSKADQEFILEVRTQAALLKVLARQVKQHLSRKGDHSADTDLEKARQALAEVEKILFNMTGGVRLTA